MSKKPTQKKNTVVKKKKRRPSAQRIGVTIVAIVMLLSILLPILAQVIVVASATQSEIDALEAQQAESQARQEELESELEAIEAEQASASQTVSVLTAQLTAINSELSIIEAQILAYDEEIAVQEGERLELVALEEEQYALFCQRVRSMEEDGNVSYWSCIFGAEDFADLLDRITIVNDIIDYDQAVMNQLEATREAIEAVMADLEAAKLAQEEKQGEYEVLQLAQQDKIAEAQAVVDEISASAEAVNDLIDEENAVWAELNSQITAKQAQMEADRVANNITIDPGSGYLWPLPGFYTLTSKYGPRIHPITGVYNNHSGTDISATGGTPILAARGGQVITATYHWSYGNYVVIDHGNGDSTLYAHMNTISVSEGDIITQGSQVGTVGTTGSSTGNHLHFEVRVAGERVDPESFYPNITFNRLY